MRQPGWSQCKRAQQHPGSTVNALLFELALGTMEFPERFSWLRKERSLTVIDGMILKHHAKQVIPSAATKLAPPRAGAIKKKKLTGREWARA